MLFRVDEMILRNDQLSRIDIPRNIFSYSYIFNKKSMADFTENFDR